VPTIEVRNEQQAQLHMNVEAQEEEGGKEQEAQEGHQMLHVTLAQGGFYPTTGHTSMDAPLSLPSRVTST